MIQRLICSALLLLAVASWFGCNEKDPFGRQAVGGTVTLDGAPVVQGSIAFEPTDQGPVRSGGIIKDGAYRVSAAKGLPPGKYLVKITAPDPTFFQRDAASRAGQGGPANLAPPEYSKQSDKFVTVTEEGPNEFNFDMKTKP